MQAQDNFKFDLIGTGDEPFRGYNSASDRTNLKGAWLVRGSKNVFKKDSGTIATRPGLKRRGSADTTLADVKSSFEWPTSLGATRVLRVCNSKLQVESDVVTSGTYVWYDLMTSLSLTRFVFDTWWDNTLKKDKLLFVKGDSNLHSWHGGIGKIVATGATTVTLNASVASLGFNTTSGSVTINGTTYTYSGTSGSDLTGVAADPTGEAVDSVVLSAIETSATTPASGFDNDFLKVNNNMVAVGSYNSRLVYISEDSDFTDFTTDSSPRAPGEAEIITLDDQATGITVRQGKFHISAGDSDWYVISFSQITVGSSLTEQTIVDKLPTSNLEAALAHEFIDNVGDDIVYVSKDQKLKILGTFKNFATSQFPTISQEIETELSEDNLTGGHLRAVGEFVYITAPVNGRVWLLQTKTAVDEQGNIFSERIWHPPFIWNLSRIAVISGVEYGHSNANPQMYQMWDTLQWHDDSPGDEALPYDCVLSLAYRQGKSRTEKIKLNKVYYEGYLSPGSTVNAAVVLDYQGSNGVQIKELNGEDFDAKLYTGDLGISLGDASLGDSPLGDQTSEEEADQEQLPKFREIINLNPTDVFEFQLRVYSEQPDSRWEILCLGANAQESTNKPIEIQH